MKKQAVRRVFYFALSVIALASMGCSRDNGKSSAVSIDVSSLTGAVRSQSAGNQRTIVTPAYVQHIVINVRDNNGNLLIPPINWDSNCHCYPSVTVPVPSSFSVTIPNGTSKTLVQVVVAGSTTATGVGGTTIIRYGDTTVDMSGGQDQTANVVESTFGTGNGASGTVVGKYMEATAGVGRTGQILMQIVPPGNKPAVAVQTIDMIGGWFQLNINDGIPFRYIFEDGTVLFNSLMLSSGNLIVNGTAASLTTQSLMQVNVPQYYQLQSGACNLNQNAQINFYGFFGNSSLASTASVVYPSATSTPQSYAYTSNACSTNLNWVPTSTASTDVNRNAQGGAVSGSGTAFSNMLTLTGSQMTSSNTAAGFQSAYQLNTSTQQALTLTPSSGMLTVAWTYLNTEAFTGANPLAGTEIFYKKYAATDTSFNQINNNGGVSCALLPSMGFTSAGSTSGASQVSLNIPSVAATDSIGVIACPFQTNLFGIVKRYFQSSANTGMNIGFSANNSPLGLPVATTLTLTSFNGTAAMGSCLPVHISTRTASGALGVLPSTGWTMSGSSGSWTMYSDASCATPFTLANLPASVNDTYYFKLATSTGTAGLTLTGGGVSGSTSVTAASVASSPTLVSVVLDRPTVNMYECATGSFVFLDSSSKLVSSSSGSPTVTLASTGSVSIYQYSDTTCSNALSSFVVSTGVTNGLFRYKASSGGTSNLSATATSTTMTSANSPTVTPNTATTPSILTIWPAAAGFYSPLSTISANTCYPIYVQFLDSNSLAAPFTAAQTLTLSSTSSSGIIVGANPSCSGSSTNPPYSPTGVTNSAYMPVFYLKTTATGQFPITITNGTLPSTTITLTSQ